MIENKVIDVLEQPKKEVDNYHLVELAGFLEEAAKVLDDVEGDYLPMARYLYGTLKNYFDSKKPNDTFDKLNAQYFELKAAHDKQTELLAVVDKEREDLIVEVKELTKDAIELRENNAKTATHKWPTTARDSYQFILCNDEVCEGDAVVDKLEEVIAKLNNVEAELEVAVNDRIEVEATLETALEANKAMHDSLKRNDQRIGKLIDIMGALS